MIIPLEVAPFRIHRFRERVVRVTKQTRSSAKCSGVQMDTIDVTNRAAMHSSQQNTNEVRGRTTIRIDAVRYHDGATAERITGPPFARV
jgi:hypothetical protein